SKKDWLHGTTKLPRGGPPAGSCPKFWVNRSPKRPENEVVPGLRPYPVGVATNRGSVWERAKVERVRIATIKNFFIFLSSKLFRGRGKVRSEHLPVSLPSRSIDRVRILHVDAGT